MKLGLGLGYAPPGTNPADLFPLVQEAEQLGFDSVWVAEAWGTDAVSVLGWLAARTERIKLGSAIMQIPGRTPANTAMTAATLDLLSGGRFLLGLGTSGPQVVDRSSRAGTASRGGSRSVRRASTSRSSARRCSARSSSITAITTGSRGTGRTRPASASR